MRARVTTLGVPPDRMDDAARHVREQVLPRLSQMEGFEGFVALGSRQSGRLQGLAFWESEGRCGPPTRRWYRSARGGRRPSAGR